MAQKNQNAQETSKRISLMRSQCVNPGSIPRGTLGQVDVNQVCPCIQADDRCINIKALHDLKVLNGASKRLASLVTVDGRLPLAAPRRLVEENRVIVGQDDVLGHQVERREVRSDAVGPRETDARQSSALASSVDRRHFSFCFDEDEGQLFRRSRQPQRRHLTTKIRNNDDSRQTKYPSNWWTGLIRSHLDFSVCSVRMNLAWLPSGVLEGSSNLAPSLSRRLSQQQIILVFFQCSRPSSNFFEVIQIGPLIDLQTVRLSPTRDMTYFIHTDSRSARGLNSSLDCQLTN